MNATIKRLVWVLTLTSMHAFATITYDKNIINVFDCIQKANGDVTLGIQKAIDSAATPKSGEKTVFFPAGLYEISNTITLPQAAIRIIGETSIGHKLTGSVQGNRYGSFVKWKNSQIGRDKYLFRTRGTGSATYVTIENMAFEGSYILDLTSEIYEPNRATIRECSFSSDPIANGIAINLVNHDFSSIEGCSFFGFNGGCGIRIDGEKNIGVREKTTTQVKVRNCNFQSSTKIGISINWANTIDISGCDFAASKGVGVDVGGEYFYAMYPSLVNDTNKLIYRGGDTRNDYYWGDVIVRNSHFENMSTGLNAKGDAIRCIGVSAMNNDFSYTQDYQSKDGGKNLTYTMMRFSDVIHPKTRDNEMEFWNGVNIPEATNKYIGIKYKNCANAKFIDDNFYCSGTNCHTGSVNYFAYLDSSTVKEDRYKPVIIAGENSYHPIVDDPNRKPILITGKFRLTSGSNLDNEMSEIQGSAPIPAYTFSNSTQISSTKELSPGDTIRLTNISWLSSGTLYLKIRMYGLADFATIWVNAYPNVVTKISGEESFGVYKIYQEGENLIFKYTPNDVAKRQCSVSGVYVGLK